MSAQHLPPIIPTLRGRCSAYAVPPCPPPNALDLCAQANAVNWKRIYKDPNFQKLQLPTRYWNLNAPPFDMMPSDAIRLNVPGNVPLSSLVANTDNVILQYTVPFGFEGIINENLHLFVIQPGGGPPYQDGSGGLVWRLLINQYLVTYYTAMNTQMGSLSNSGAMYHTGGIRIKSNQTITYAVDPTAPALAGLDPNGQFVAGFRGWIYPMH